MLKSVRFAAIGIAAGVAASLLLGCATNNPDVRNRAEMQRRLADVKLSKGQFELAIREYRRSLAIYDGDPEVYFGLAEAYRRKGLLEDAEAQLLEALRLDPAHQEARLNLGVVYLMQERWEDAIEQNELLLDDPTFLRPSRALVNLGWAQYRSGQLAPAKAAFVEALAGESGNAHATLNLGIVLYDMGEVLESLRYFQRAVDLCAEKPQHVAAPLEAEARFRMAQAHVKLGQLERAIGHLRVASERGGKGEWGEKSREYLRVLR